MNNKNRFEKWGKTREKGKIHYIFYYGVLGWGLTAGILSFFFNNTILKHGLNFSKYFTGDWITSLVFCLFSCFLGGIVFGYLMWGTNENHYNDTYLNK